jgi:putative DNA methylase
MWLADKKGRRHALRWVRDKNGRVTTIPVERRYANGKTLQVRQPVLEIFTPSISKDLDKGTSQGGAATCPITGFTTSVESVRRQLSDRLGGARDARLICTVTTRPGAVGRFYNSPEDSDLKASEMAATALEQGLTNGFVLPTGELNHLRGFFNVVLYGMKKWQDLFAPRQALALLTLTKLVDSLRNQLLQLHDPDFAAAVQTCLAIAVDRQADSLSSLTRWQPSRETNSNTFGRQALPMVWDYVEPVPISDSAGSLGNAVQWIIGVIKENSCLVGRGVSEQSSATALPLPDDSADALITDPPYYAAIPYADLSDFFYSWLRISLVKTFPLLFKDTVTPKDEECVSLAHRAAMYRHKDNAWFEKKMLQACIEARRVTKPSGIGVFVFANKETAGWEAMLSALVSAGWIVTASWPIDTEMGSRLRARNSATLASSVHLVCRPRGEQTNNTHSEELIGDWRDVLQQLPKRMHEWMPQLAQEGIVGADAIFSCLGPALEVFSQFSRVEKASGEAVTLREYLEHVWAAVAKEALSMLFKGADASGFEEDARLTAMWLWTLSAGEGNGTAKSDEASDEEGDDAITGAPKGYVLEYDAARKIAQGLGAHLESLTSLVEIKGEIARLFPVSERTRNLFRHEDRESQATTRKKKTQLNLGFEEELEQAEEAGEWGSKGAPELGTTVLDRVHQSMILFGANRGEALRRFLVDEGAGRDERFWRLAQVLSYLYPKTSEEKRWIDGVLARKKSLGF